MKKSDPINSFECTVQIDSKSVELTKNETHTFQANIESNQPGKCSEEISWKSTNSEVGSIDQNGEFTALKEGETDVIVCSKQFPEKCDKANINVYELDVAIMAKNENDNKDIYLISSKKKGVIKKITSHSKTDAAPIEWTKDGKNVLFASYRTEGPSIFMTETKPNKKHGPRNLTRNLDFAQNPDLSPDENHLVVEGRKTRDGYMEIYKFNLETKKASRLTFEKVKSGAKPNNPNWSPDGEKIAYSSAKSGNYEIYIMDADGSNKINATKTTNQGEGYPSWSPDGEKIAYTSSGTIYVMNSNGSNKKQLGSGFSPEWTPNGKITFCGPGDRIYVMNADGSNVKTIASTSDFEDVNYIAYPSWKPQN